MKRSQLFLDPSQTLPSLFDYSRMAGLGLDHSVPAGLVEDDRRPSLEASLEKKDPVPMDDDDDSAHEGLEFPSEEELATLRRVSDAIPWAAYSWWSPAFPISIPMFCGSDRRRRVGGTFLGKCIDLP